MVNSKLVYVLLVILLSSGNVVSKNNNISRLDRAWKAVKSACERDVCSHLLIDERTNCVNECTSKVS